MYNITSKMIIEGYNRNVKRLNIFTVIIAQKRRQKVLNWYADRIMEEHNERVDRALKQYAIDQALGLPHKPALRTRTIFWLGDRMVSWGRKLQIRESRPIVSSGVTANAHR